MDAHTGEPWRSFTDDYGVLRVEIPASWQGMMEPLVMAKDGKKPADVPMDVWRRMDPQPFEGLRQSMTVSVSLTSRDDAASATAGAFADGVPVPASVGIHVNRWDGTPPGWVFDRVSDELRSMAGLRAKHFPSDGVWDALEGPIWVQLHLSPTWTRRRYISADEPQPPHYALTDAEMAARMDVLRRIVASFELLIPTV